MATLAMTKAAVWRTSKTDALRVERRLFFIWDRKDGSNASHCAARAFCNMNGKGKMVLGEREKERKRQQRWLGRRSDDHTWHWERICDTRGMFD